MEEKNWATKVRCPPVCQVREKEHKDELMFGSVLVCVMLNPAAVKFLLCVSQNSCGEKPHEKKL